MGNHFILFPVMIIVCLFYTAWYAIKIIWLLGGAVCLLVEKIYKRIMNKSEVNNNGIVR